jgi:hypothetical protein
MKKLLALFIYVFITLASGITHAETDDQILLNAFHKYGLNKCDKFILANSKLGENWNFFISQHVDAIDDNVKEVSIIQIFGSKNDTVKRDISFIQSKKGCFYQRKTTVTYSGACSQNLDLDAWYVAKEMQSKDYKQYKNKGGVDMYVKEISVGNFKACIQESDSRNSVPLE